MSFTIYCDGGCRGNPGPGGFGAVVIDDDTRDYWQLYGYEKQTTNNRMEMRACKEALLFLKRYNMEGPVHVKSDSNYLVMGVTSWRAGWEKKNFKKVMNEEQWKELFELIDSFEKIEWTWVKGHAGLKGNELADSLANLAMDTQETLLP